MPADRGLFKVSDFLSSSGAGAFILKQRLRKIHDMFDVVLIDVQPSRSQICLSAVGASDHVLIPVEANVKGVNSLVDTLDFLNEQAELEAFTGSVLGIVPCSLTTAVPLHPNPLAPTRLSIYSLMAPKEYPPG